MRRRTYRAGCSNARCPERHFYGRTPCSNGAGVQFLRIRKDRPPILCRPAVFDRATADRKETKMIPPRATTAHTTPWGTIACRPVR